MRTPERRRYELDADDEDSDELSLAREGTGEHTDPELDPEVEEPSGGGIDAGGGPTIRAVTLGALSVALPPKHAIPSLPRAMIRPAPAPPKRRALPAGLILGVALGAVGSTVISLLVAWWIFAP